MAGLFAHVWIANLVLQKLSAKGFISMPENIDDYFFGAVAPDIRYISNTGRDVTHKPKGENSIFEALKISSNSMPFMAGYETHLIVDDTWSNGNGSMEESIYAHYGLDANNFMQKFSLYFAVDDYFQGESSASFQAAASINILKANDYSVLTWLGFSKKDIENYKIFSAGYIREPGFDTFNVFNFFPNEIDEKILKSIVDQLPSLTSFLKEFKSRSVEKCLESLEQYL